MKKYLIVLLVLLVVASVGASSWPMFHQNARHTGQSDVVAAQTDSLKWVLDLGVRVSPCGGPSVAFLNGEERIVVGTMDGIHIIKPDGTFETFIPTTSAVIRVPALTEEAIYFADGDFLMACLPDGSYWWSFYIGDDISHVALWGNRVYVNGGNRLWAFTLDGDFLWTTNELGGGIDEPAPTVGKIGTIYVATLGNVASWYDFRVYAFNPDGSERWVYEGLFFEPGGIQTTPAIDGSGNIYFATRYVCNWGGGFYSLKGGELNWCRDAVVTYSSPAIGNNGIYYGTSQGLTARSANGDLLWIFPVAYGIVVSSPAIGADGTVYIGSRISTFFAIDKQGNLKWSYDCQDGKLGSPAIGADGTVYVAGLFGKLFAFAGPGTGVKEAGDKVVGTQVKIYPNPFANSTLIKYQLPVTGYVEIDVYNIAGQLVKKLVSQEKAAGRYQIHWNAKNENNQSISSGTYFLRFQSGKFSQTKKLIVVN